MEATHPKPEKIIAFIGIFLIKNMATSKQL